MAASRCSRYSNAMTGGGRGIDRGRGGLQDVGSRSSLIDGVLKEFLTREERVQIERIVILSDDYEPVVKLIHRVQSVNGSGPVELENINFYQFLIRTALIFHAEPAEVGAVHA